MAYKISNPDHIYGDVYKTVMLTEPLIIVHNLKNINNFQ